MRNSSAQWPIRKIILGNSGNQCYLNSLALAMPHACVQDTEWHSLHGNPVHSRLCSREQVILRSWIRPGVQRDICELCHSISARENLPWFEGMWEARAIMDGHCCCLDQSSLQTPIALDLVAPATTRGLIDEWHGNQHGVQALVSAPECIALHIKKVQCRG